MGPSGSGKLTLLSIPAGLVGSRKSKIDATAKEQQACFGDSRIVTNNDYVLYLSGEIHTHKTRKIQVSQQQWDSFTKRLIDIMWQDHILISNLTVCQTVKYAARLKTALSQGHNPVPQLVDDIPSNLELTSIQNSIVGNNSGTGGGRSGSTRGINGGEQKYVSVAQEFVTPPTPSFSSMNPPQDSIPHPPCN